MDYTTRTCVGIYITQSCGWTVLTRGHLSLSCPFSSFLPYPLNTEHLWILLNSEHIANLCTTARSGFLISYYISMWFSHSTELCNRGRVGVVRTKEVKGRLSILFTVRWMIFTNIVHRAKSSRGIDRDRGILCKLDK